VSDLSNGLFNGDSSSILSDFERLIDAFENVAEDPEVSSDERIMGSWAVFGTAPTVEG
jgi:hypothetical protein